MPTTAELHLQYDGATPAHLLDAARGRHFVEWSQDQWDLRQAQACARLQFDKARGEIKFARRCLTNPLFGDFHSRRRKARAYLENWAGYIRIAASIQRRLARPFLNHAYPLNAHRRAMQPQAERVRKLIVEHLGVAPEKVTDDARIAEDLGADSLDAVELIVRLRKE